MARCLQHECDHLDGKLYVDRLDRDVRREVLRAVQRL
jgi:peptide deformylase